MIREEYRFEDVVPGKRLGRHVRHDPRSLAYPFKAPTIPLASRRWSKSTDPILDQGDLGSCTGNATVGALLCSNSSPLNSALTSAQVGTLSEELAVRIYSRATETDPWEGTYLPDDTGSDGLDVAKAAKEFGYISGYTHALTLTDALTALTTSPVIIGVNWYSGMDSPLTSGAVTPTGTNRGGHEICLDEINVEKGIVWFRNSWSSGWGVRGRAYLTFDGLGKLLQEDGDATVFVPLSVPAPAPVPTPNVVDDEALSVIAKPWVAHKKYYPSNEKLRQTLIPWLQAKGY